MQALLNVLPIVGLASVVAAACHTVLAPRFDGAGSAEDQAVVIIDGESTGVTFAQLGLVSLDCDPGRLPPAQAEVCRVKRHLEGRRLFDEETFAGNGRTCATCHAGDNGTITREEVAQRLGDPSDPLFLHDGLDDFLSGTSRIASHATILVERRLPPHVVLVDDPAARSIVVRRGVPTTVNTAALDPALMYDVRDPDLQTQALGAIQGHAQSAVEPTPLELELLAEFQRTDSRFFSSGRLETLALDGGPEPALPQGRTPSERRGREFFLDVPFEPPAKAGVCALCHSGPLLNRPNEFMTDVIGAPPGWSAFTVLVSERNLMNNPVYTFEVTDPCGAAEIVESPDPGLLLTDPYTVPILGPLLPSRERCELHPAFFANMFKTPQLRNLDSRAPYFHDNSARTLEDVMEHYNFYFEQQEAPFQGIQLTPQEIEDVIAFLRLL
jgi:cytochrome c peroxidase